MDFLIGANGLLFMNRLGRNNEHRMCLLRYLLEKRFCQNEGKMWEFQI